ncbi:hypothetical protein SAMN05216354_0302 [Xylanibacter ruminicola]|jgi:uncharacterized membrane protein|uniref:DUF6249 domain-containing protein n=1 Tax=Xylanibacter ruminicola TaxID=839 RepID=A0A1H5RTZ2_XYLRU|nr:MULTISPECIES: DUF6249 domain-containing protein [Prevotellaceae]SEF41208.1 hypothetical protein SAMN05216354_0302 [Xylanibacter ruminicola]SEW11079.1 hypothetical protein SAMN04487827_1586 [Prevotella sp. khp7]
MKKYLFAIAMVLALGMNVEAAAQKHRHTPRTEQVDSTKNKQNAIEAFSDTTAVADAQDAEDDSYITSRHRSHDDADRIVHSVFSGLGNDEILGMGFVLLIILTIFLFAPIGIIIAIFYFVNKNRREKYKLAQMAIQNGQPIPDDVLKEKQDDWDRSDYQTGVRQMFTGVGLAIFLGIILGKLGIGIGALVFFIGLGKWYISRKSNFTENGSQKRQDMEDWNNNSNV